VDCDWVLSQLDRDLLAHRSFSSGYARCRALCFAMSIIRLKWIPVIGKIA